MIAYRLLLPYYCCSALLTHSQVRSCRYSRVIGADLSPAMLGETARRFDAEKLQRPEFIRCDVTRLPVVSSSVDGIHAGAALHCWSKLELALQEVRVCIPAAVQTRVHSANALHTTHCLV
jgi:ubiquinone/menaquinone biosynthesis C-methylase UbiE